MGALAAATPYENLPLGFRFKPTDVELIDHYLRLKINRNDNEVACIKEIDICRVEPWDLPDLSAIKTNDSEWFYFCPRDRKYPNGQRSNRATEAGYWKATGKDRTIKSRKLGIIGMKKTLVFYTGRAPKGQRTNWVIHEYRTTLKELDGSHPGQGAFVLCRLFKKAEELKQDDNDDASHTGEVETNICSPYPTNITHEDIRLESAVQDSPGSVEQKMFFEKCNVKTSDSLTSETICPDRPQMIEEMTPEVDSHVLGGFHFDEDDPGLYLWPEPMGMAEIFPTEISDGHSGLKLQDINGGRDPISDFLDSLLVKSDQGAQTVESDIWNYSAIKESGSCSGSDVEVVQQQHDMDYICSISNDNYYNEPMGNMDLSQNHPLVDDDDIFSDAALDRFCSKEQNDYTSSLPASFVKAEDAQMVGNSGITIRSRICSRQAPSENFKEQGTAARRLRLQMVKEQESKSIVSEDPTIPPCNNFICLEDLGENMVKRDDDDISSNAALDRSCSKESIDYTSSLPASFVKAEDDQVGNSGIRIRPRICSRQVSSENFKERGTAARRIRLQMVKEKESNSIVSEDPTVPPCKDFICLEDLGENMVKDDENESSVDSTHLQRSPPSASKFVDQGTAHRRTRLQLAPSDYHAGRDDAQPPLLSEIRKLSEELSDDDSDCRPDIKPTSFKRPTSPMPMDVKVVMVVFLFIACVGLWIARNVYMLPSFFSYM